MSCRSIDPLGQVVEYVNATRWSADVNNRVINIFNKDELIATVEDVNIVTVVPFSQVDPGVEGAD